MSRNPIRGSLRFEILDRDDFTCQYCGAKAPDVLLHVDHIIPVARGGTDSPDNLITACHVCNLGKSKALLGGFKSPTERSEMISRMGTLMMRNAELELGLERWDLPVELDRAIDDYGCDAVARAVRDATAKGIKTITEFVHFINERLAHVRRG